MKEQINDLLWYVPQEDELTAECVELVTQGDIALRTGNVSEAAALYLNVYIKRPSNSQVSLAWAEASRCENALSGKIRRAEASMTSVRSKQAYDNANAVALSVVLSRYYFVQHVGMYNAEHCTRTTSWQTLDFTKQVSPTLLLLLAYENWFLMTTDNSTTLTRLDEISKYLAKHKTEDIYAMETYLVLSRCASQAGRDRWAVQLYKKACTIRDQLWISGEYEYPALLFRTLFELRE